MVTRNCRSALFGLLGTALLISTVSAQQEQRLENKEFGFSVLALPGLVSCVEASPAGGHRHGFNLLLRPDAQGCRSLKPQPYVMILGDYNVVPYPTPQEWLRKNYKCPRQRPGSDQSEYMGLTFPGHASAFCEDRGKNGWVDIFVVTGQGSWPRGSGVPVDVPYIYYTATLHTTSERLKEDMRTFRMALGRVNILAPR